MYHRVVPFAQAGNSLHGLVVPPDLFAAQMAALKSAGWHTVTLGTLARDLASGLRPAPKTFVVSLDDGYDDGFTYAWPILQREGFVATYFVIPGRIGNSNQLTVAHLRALSAAGNEIADHTMDHVDLAHQNPARLRYEIDGAAERIAQITGKWPSTLAYPFGSFDAAVANGVAACSGIEMAVTTQPGAHETWAGRYDVPRIRVSPSSTPGSLVAALAPYA